MPSDTQKLTDTVQRDASSSVYSSPLTDRGPATEYVPKLQQNAEKLRHVAQQVESFLMRQIDRLQRELQQVESPDDRYELERLSEEFEQMRDKWDAERQLERSRIQEDSSRLVEAWQRLEAEQRELLKYRTPNKIAGLSTGRSAVRSGSPLSPVPASSSKETSMVGATMGSPATAASHRNQLQFQQLRREMMEHARQRRKR
jgi:hypothetical protein